jgi:hypothetical protein
MRPGGRNVFRTRPLSDRIWRRKGRFDDLSDRAGSRGEGERAMLLAKLLVLGGLMVMVYSAVRAVQTRNGLDSRVEVLPFLVMKALPARRRTPQAILSSLARKATAVKLVMPSGSTAAAAHVELSLAPVELAVLTDAFDLGLVTDELGRAYLAHARRAGWKLPEQRPVVSLYSDPNLTAGWVTAVLGSSKTAGDLAGDYAAAGCLAGPSEVVSQGGSTRAYGAPPTRATALSSGRGEEQGWFVLCNDKGGEFALVGQIGPGAVLRIGRASDNDLVVTDEAASRRHAELTVDAHRLVLVDLGSANGTWVNGSRISVPVELTGGERVRFGSRSGLGTEFRVGYRGRTRQAR